MKKYVILLFSMAAVIGISPDELKGSVAYASNGLIHMDDNTAVLNGNKETSNTESIYEMEQITTKIRTNTNTNPIDKGAIPKPQNDYTDPKEIVTTDHITPETYASLIDELMHVGGHSNHLNNKVKMNGEVRYHYAVNSGAGRFGTNSSGIRLYLGADAAINKDWRAYSMLEGQNSVMNYNNEFRLSRLYAAGKVGATMVKAGSFGYLMAEGNIYDSGYKGVKVDFGEKIKYTLSHGKTNDTKKTSVATARYNHFDYNLETGVYHSQLDDGTNNKNTILTLGGNYNFSNFGVRAMILNSSLKDSNGNSKGHVLSVNYGDLKTYRPGTYEIFAKYYNQPRGTYIVNGMNGLGSSMQGFKGYGFGTHYTVARDFVGGIEYYNLTDKISGAESQTFWIQLTHYF